MSLNFASFPRLSKSLAAQVRLGIADWDNNRKVQRFWSKDSRLWTGQEENRWLGWLNVVNPSSLPMADLLAFQGEVRRKKWKYALVLGMGGSSLAPEVFAKTFDCQRGYPQLFVLDSTHPAQVNAVEKRLDPAKTLFIVASKSGTTLEPDIMYRYFFRLVQDALPGRHPGERFVAITDPGSALEQTAGENGFLKIFPGTPSIGGRFSALSSFGLVPAAVMGVKIERIISGAQKMAQACLEGGSVENNPGVFLGILLGALGQARRDKITFILSPAIRSLGAWLEQLVAESLGKKGKGLIPVDGEAFLPPSRYSDDRVFVYLRLKAAPSRKQDSAAAALERAGHPLIRLEMERLEDLGGEFFRWEVATAVAGSLLGVHPFNQPDVEASKIETRKLTQEYESTGALPAEKPLWSDGRMEIYADSLNESELRASAGDTVSLDRYLWAHLQRLKPGDYFALLAFLEMSSPVEKELAAIRKLVSRYKGVATCVGFGPRYLHSTGQAFKGGPNTGVFLHLTAEDGVDLPVPGHRYTFGVVKTAQARGDFAVLNERRRRAMRIHLGKDVGRGLKRLRATMEKILTNDRE